MQRHTNTNRHGLGRDDLILLIDWAAKVCAGRGNAVARKGKTTTQSGINEHDTQQLAIFCRRQLLSGRVFKTKSAETPGRSPGTPALYNILSVRL